MKVTVEQDRCVAAGQCAATAPDVFDQREEDGIVVLLTDAPAAALANDVRYAATVCPASAIHLTE
ncbi:ferredoxin [Actinobacteria bacterium OK074]|nr:ferredoxin [Actinobacteria bacterium OK074]